MFFILEEEKKMSLKVGLKSYLGVVEILPRTGKAFKVPKRVWKIHEKAHSINKNKFGGKWKNSGSRFVIKKNYPCAC